MSRKEMSSFNKSRPSGENIASLPSIAINGPEPSGKRMFLQKTKSNSSPKHVVPAPGREYDFRRTPEPGRGPSRKQKNTLVRPRVPSDTLHLDSLCIDDSPTTFRVKRERLDVSNCPTPMQPETDLIIMDREPQLTARSAWDNNNDGHLTKKTAKAGVCELEDIEDDQASDIYTTEGIGANIVSKPFKQRAGRTVKLGQSQNNYDVIKSDVDGELGYMAGQAPDMPLNLTEDVLQYYYQQPVNKDRRIARWLVDIKGKSQNQLPAHLPDISASNRNVTLTLDEV